ncbi:hypothetical protein CCM_09620 [Cordyceps militaris CM01]|uniref:Transmembrane protein n=1 Tax=Cordyceps militaris (strain CM01) TaxID=983644 RepID=G3JUX9_CORMM|nr:uncharacterized protein CCM_09620 [Cordyceps militaris CM01]EGX87659.1 hypothetical protein CCM_09620 [Cordyceps militaris CM01]
MHSFATRGDVVENSIFGTFGILFYAATLVQSWRHFKVGPVSAAQWYHQRAFLSALIPAITFLVGNIVCPSWIGIAHSRGLPDTAPGILWKFTVAICFALSETIKLFAVSDQVPKRKLAGACILFLQALWLVFGIWQLRSGAVWAFPAIIHGSFAAILLYQIIARKCHASHPAPPHSYFLRFFLRTLIATASLAMGCYSFVKGPLRWHFSVQCAFSLFEAVQSPVYAEMRFMKERSDRKRAAALSNNKQEAIRKLVFSRYFSPWRNSSIADSVDRRRSDGETGVAEGDPGDPGRSEGCEPRPDNLTPSKTV